MATANDQALVQQLLPLKSKLAEFEVCLGKLGLDARFTGTPKYGMKVQVKEFRQALQDVLLDDADIQQMRAIAGRSDPELQYHFEMLVEGMSQAADMMSNQTQELGKMVSGSEKVMEITLDSARNRLMRLNLFVTTGSFVVGTGALAASLLGLYGWLPFFP